MELAGLPASDAKVDGLVDVLLDATGKSDQALSTERLQDWHAALFPTGYTGMHKINAGLWRADDDGPMQVVSGRLGRQPVHFEAPPAARLDEEMTRFIAWFNNRQEEDGLLRAAIAHLWFVTLHPFEDGNGRVARAISDMALAQSEGSGQRFYSMSSQIRTERKQYYEILERTHRGDMDVTPWVKWFLECLGRALANAKSVCGAALQKADFWPKFSDVQFNDRQRKVLNLMLDGMESKLTTPKWAKIAKCSPATAHRDIALLIESGALVKGPGGSKNTNFELAI